MKLRTIEEILLKLEEVIGSNEDFFGVQKNSLIEALEYEDAKEFLKEGVTKESWDEGRVKYNLKELMQRMKEYLDFAFDKAENGRGLSAGRSLDHYRIWFWLITEPEMEMHTQDEYGDYGKSILTDIEKWLESHEAPE